MDYSDINELADDVSEVKETRQSDTLIKTEDGTDYDADDEDTCLKSDIQLMPPPPLPCAEKDSNIYEYEASAEARRRKLDTPLAAMLPSKYQNVDVTEIFPDFRVDKVWSYD